MVRWAPGTFFNPHRHFGGEEILVVEGVFSDEYGSYHQGSWIRSPHLSQHQPFSREGCLILVKTCLLYTSDAADERSSVDLGGRRIIKKKKKK